MSLIVDFNHEMNDAIGLDDQPMRAQAILSQS
jgi:hypothetical protein